MANPIKMPEINIVTIAGRATRNAELRGGKVCAFDIAATRRYQNTTTNEWEDDTCFIACVIFGKLAETMSERIVKGSPVFLRGHLQTNSWKDKDGNSRSTIQLAVDNIQLLAATGEHKAENEPATKGNNGDY